MGLLQQLKEIYHTSEVQLSTYAQRSVHEGQGKEPKFEVTIVLGDWRLGDSVKRNGVFNEEDFYTIQQMRKGLHDMPDADKYAFRVLDNHLSLDRDLKYGNIKFVLNLCDEGLMNEALMEMHVPALLEMSHIPYTGSGPTCLGMCYDKSLVRALAISVSVPVPEEIVINLQMGDKVPKISSFPRFIKPSLGDNSIGITPSSLVHSQEEAEEYISRLFGLFPDRPSLIQEYLSGTEYSVGLIGNPVHGFVRLPILEVDYSQLDPTLPPILGYESKFEPDSPYWTQIHYKKAVSLDHTIADAVYRYAERLFDRCSCRDYARFDFRMDSKGIVKLLEVNPNPGWCWDGKLNKMAAFMDWSYGQLLSAILTASRKRHNM